MKFTVPKDDAEARQVAEEHTLTGWRLAAYISCRVYLPGSGGDHKSPNRDQTVKVPFDRITAEEFAQKGIRGLRSAKTVRLYAERWRDYVGEPPMPGSVIEIPDLDWPPIAIEQVARTVKDEPRRERIRTQAEADGVGPSKAIDIAGNPKAMAAAIKADPATAKAALHAVEQAKMKAEDPTFPERLDKVKRDQEMDGADADKAIKWATDKRNLTLIDIWLMEWAKEGNVQAIDHVALRIDEVRGVIAEQADALTPEMFTEADG